MGKFSQLEVWQESHKLVLLSFPMDKGTATERQHRAQGFSVCTTVSFETESSIDVYKIAKAFPNEERFRLVDQLCRSATSVPANIAEGTGRNTLKEYIQFLYNARGSLEETKYHLLLAKDLMYMNNMDYENLRERCDQIGKMLNDLINSLKERDSD